MSPPMRLIHPQAGAWMLPLLQAGKVAWSNRDGILLVELTARDRRSRGGGELLLAVPMQRAEAAALRDALTAVLAVQQPPVDEPQAAGA